MSRYRAWALSIVALCGCNALLGIEDLQLKPDAAASPVEQREQPNERSAQDAGDASSLTSASPGPTPDAGTREVPEPKPDAGMLQPTAAAEEPATSDAGGAAAEVTSPVTGTVVDYRRRPLPGVSVRIAEQETTTDAQGQFTLPSVPSRYDVTLLIRTSITNNATTHVWQFQGLSRRDPTLQVYRGLPENYAEFRLHIDNVTFPLQDDQDILMAWSSPDGDFALDTTYADLEYLSPMWTGPSTSAGVVHALWVTKSGGVPREFHAYDARDLVMTANTQSQASFDLGAANAAAGSIQSTVVAGPGIGDRRNEVYLRFRDDNAALKLVDDWTGADALQYPVPNLPGSTITVVAKRVAQPPGIVAAYAEIAVGDPAPTLTLPQLPALVAPDAGKSHVDPETEFHWTAGNQVVMLCVRAIDTYDAIYVVTEAQQTRLPIGVEFGHAPPANSDFTWSVEVHDAYKTIDEATSETGHLSAYAAEEIRGPRRGAGTWSRSVPRVFTTAP